MNHVELGTEVSVSASLFDGYGSNPYNVITKKLHERNIAYVDLREYSLKRERPHDSYGKCDPHFSPMGHVWAAEAICTKLTDIKNP